jgi:hypothetical protein
MLISSRPTTQSHCVLYRFPFQPLARQLEALKLGVMLTPFISGETAFWNLTISVV